MTSDMRPVFSVPPVIWPVEGRDMEREGGFPVRRVFCVGKNYADHIAEMAKIGMGSDAKRSEPVIFTKDATCLVRPGGDVPYPPATSDLHHEVELVVAIGPDGVWGHAVGIDLTRRDLQAAAKERGGPWDRAKSFAASAPMGAIREGMVSHDAAITLSVNGEERQRSVLAKMIWGVGEVIQRLREDMDLRAGDLIFTGTPAGVGPVVAGDVMEAKVDGLPSLRVRVI